MPRNNRPCTCTRTSTCTVGKTRAEQADGPDRLELACSPRDFLSRRVIATAFGMTESGFERAGFVNRGGKGSHRNFVHPSVTKPVVLSGKLGDDAKYYQVRAVQLALEESKK